MRIPGGTLIPDVSGGGGAGCGFVLLAFVVIFVILPDKRASDKAKEESRARMLAEAPNLIMGTWRYSDSLVTYLADGTKIDKYDNGWIVKSLWSLQGDTILINAVERNGRRFAQHTRFRILELTSSFFLAEDENGRSWSGQKRQEAHRPMPAQKRN